tara:strand:+ start:566 stop:1990 length:1425 start_codon:yes stop_codon:yes gene_type:complete
MRIIIVGGGTSGWCTSAAILHELPYAKVVLIDKDVPIPLGVGEATLIGFESFLSNTCGFDSNEFLKELDVGLKGGILFPDWGYEGSNVWHPFNFQRYPFSDSPVPMTDAWSNHQDRDFQKLMALYITSMSNKIDKGALGDAYALHVDCLKLIKYIRKKIEDSIKFIKSEVKTIKRDGSGNINTLILENGEEVYGDLFVDCTGFNSVLKDNRDRVDLSDRLYVNTALAGHIPYTNRKEQFKPYVNCPAVDSGWIWEIPLQSRIGSGIVFNRDITSPEEARQEFYDHWGQEVDLKLIDWTPYYDNNMWDKNVVSIGLSAGFIEPLESTGLALIIEGIGALTRLIGSGYYNQYDINYFNAHMKFGFEQCIDFVNMHYSKSHKDTKFWNYVRDNYKMSKAQEFYQENMLSQDPTVCGGKGFIFGGMNWINWLIQMGYDISPKSYFNPDNLNERLQVLEGTTEDDVVDHLEFCSQFLCK